MSREKTVKKVNPIRIYQQNNEYRIKEVLRHDNILDVTMSKHTREDKEINILLVKKGMNLHNNSTSHRKQ